MTQSKAPSLSSRLRDKSGAMTFRPGIDSADPGDNFRLLRVAKWAQALLPADGSLLDIGCWTGGLALALDPEHRGSYVGVDIEAASDAVECARATVPQASFEVVSSVEALPFGACTFDVVTLTEVIEHVPPANEGSLLAEAARVLRPQGNMLLTTPLDSALNALDPAWFFGHRHYSVDRLKRIAEAQGLIVREVRLGGGIWTSLDTDLFYVYKHVLRRPYARMKWLRSRVEREHDVPSSSLFGTALWCRLQRASPALPR